MMSSTAPEGGAGGEMVQRPERVGGMPAVRGSRFEKRRGAKGRRAGRTHVLDDDGVDAGLCDASYHLLKFLELRIKYQDVERHVAVHATLM